MHPSSARSIVDLTVLCGSAVHSVMPSTIARSDFQKGVALKQMENKFIALVCKGVLSVVDQHAADERVRLEKLRAAVLGAQVGCCLLFTAHLSTFIDADMAQSAWCLPSSLGCAI